MIINAIKLRAATADGDYGFAFNFSKNLTVVRAKNSSGKSTLFNSVLYGLGMEELIGGRNEKVLPYALKEYFRDGEKRVEVLASEIFLELSNKVGKTITLRRVIRDAERDTKLIEVFASALLSKGEQLNSPTPYYLHDGGSAKKSEGFFHFLESFLGLNLPSVPTTGGGEAKLYLQTVFASLAVEQKRGWTDYIANVPFYGLRDVRTRVVEYVLGLDVFNTIALRNKLNSESVEIDLSWRKIVSDFTKEISLLGLELHGVSISPNSLFNETETSILKRNEKLSISETISLLRTEYQALNQQAESFSQVSGNELTNKFKQLTEELQYLTILQERSLVLLDQQKTSLNDYLELRDSAVVDLDKNKSIRKLQRLGANYNLKTAIGTCPTCNQDIKDSLLSEVISGPQMDLDTNIAYLDSQRKMLIRQISGLTSGIQSTEMKLIELNERIAEKRDILVALRNDVTSGSAESKAIVRRQVQIEVEVDAVERLQLKSIEIFRQLAALSVQFRKNQEVRKALPKEGYSNSDLRKIDLFQKNFRANAGSFGYESAPIKEVEISKDNLVPCLSQMELREIRTDIKSDSSASDFVRLIWSYLLALYQTSSTKDFEGHHLGVLMLDEPGQHSMAVDSQHSLLKQLATERGLQSIIAASFDENEDVFLQATQGLEFQLIEWDGKLIKKL